VQRLAVSVGVLLVCALPYACGGSRHVSTPTNHRAVAPAACTPQPILGGMCVGSMGTMPCASSSDCTAGLDGSCNDVFGACSCIYDACLTDDDCGPGTACTCDGHRGGAGSSGTFSPTACVASNCRLDSDCGPGGFCSPSPNDLCGTVGGFYCHTSHDECGDDSDCTGSTCVYSPEVGHWICSLGGGCGGG
jgi:hypothetical protein